MTAWRDKSPSDKALAVAMALRGLVGPVRALAVARRGVEVALDLSRALETITHPAAPLGNVWRAAKHVRTVARAAAAVGATKGTGP